MNRKKIVVVLLVTLVFLAGVPESFARPLYFNSLRAVYGDGSCGTCHIKASGGGQRNDYGTLFENQPDHATDPGSALMAIGPPPTATTTLTPTATVTPLYTPIVTDSPVETATTAVTTNTGIQSAPGFGIMLSLIGLFVWALLERRHNK